MKEINSNIVDIYHPDAYCTGEEYEGVRYPDAYLGERIMNLNGCEGREEGQYGISTRRCGLTGWQEPKYYCTSSIANFETTIQKSAADTIDDDKYEFAYNTHKGPLINTTFVYNHIHQRGGEEALLDYYNNVITTSNTTDLIYEPERYCKINYGAGHDMYINNHSNRVYALKNSNDKYMYVTCTQDDDKGTHLTIVQEGPSNMFAGQCDGSGWTYSPPIFKRNCKAGTQYGYCKDGSIENLNGNICTDVIPENEIPTGQNDDKNDDTGNDGKDESGSNWWIWIILIVIVLIIIVVFVMRKNPVNKEMENN